jgi:hypothetical protein
VSSSTRRSTLLLLGVLAVAALLRLAGLSWGIPRYTPELAAATPIRTSFHPDEDKILWQLERMRPWDLDPRDFGWGTFQTYAVGACLEAGDAASLFGDDGWRAAFRQAREPFFSRVFLVGRGLAALFGTATVLLTFRVARGAGSPRAGLAAASLLAVSPLHVLHSHYLTADVTLGFWLTAALWMSLQGRSALAAFLGGLALATKPSAVVAVPQWLSPARTPRSAALIVAALAVGFLLAEPYALLAFRDWWARTAETSRAVWLGSAVALPVHRLLLAHAWQIVGYGLGPVGAGLALCGLKRGPGRLLGLTSLLLAGLLLSRFPMSRYVVPLLPALAVAFGLGWAGLRVKARAATAALALLPLALVSIGLLGVLRREHTAGRAEGWMRATAVPGARVARLWDEIPLLDSRVHRLEALADPFGLEGRVFAPPTADFVILDDLPIHAWRPGLLLVLDTEYEVAARFANPPTVFGLELPEPFAAHDWRYTHPVIRVYRRRPESQRTR